MASSTSCSLRFWARAKNTLLAKDTSQVFVLKGFSKETLAEARALLAMNWIPPADLYTSAPTKLHLARVLTERVMNNSSPESRYG